MAVGKNHEIGNAAILGEGVIFPTGRPDKVFNLLIVGGFNDEIAVYQLFKVDKK